MTALEKLASLPKACSYLREGITLNTLHQQASAMTDLQAANALNKANCALFDYVMKKENRA